MTSRHTHALFNLFLIILIFMVNTLAMVYSWYWQIKWLDNIMHSMGGLFMGSAALYVYYLSGYIEPHHKSIFFAFIFGIGMAAIAGIFWEVFEFILDTFVEKPVHLLYQPDIADTMGDLVLGLCGAFTSVVLYILVWKTK